MPSLSTIPEVASAGATLFYRVDQMPAVLEKDLHIGMSEGRGGWIPFQKIEPFGTDAEGDPGDGSLDRGWSG